MLLRSAVRPFAVFLFLVSAVAGTRCLAGNTEFMQRYHLQPGGSFELSNVNGAVRIEAWDEDVVEVRAVKSSTDKNSNLDLVSIDIDSRPDALTVATRYPHENGAEVAVDYTIHVPRKALLAHVNTVNGTLRVSQADSVGDLHTVNGNIEVYGSGGNVHAHTTNGNVYLELKNPSDARGAQAETTNGSVMLAIPANIQANLEARCMNGSFTSDLPVEMEGAVQPRVLHGKLGHGGVPIRLGTVNGAIRVVALRAAI
jgi:DUF4097 and DUF4098 domain-containing protein YvlB